MNLAPNAAAPPETAYLFTSFRGNGDGLHLAYSEDALHWTDLGSVFLEPTVGGGLLRDPHILRAPDGVFHLVWTTGWKDKGIGYATSRDLIHWSEQRYLPLMEGIPGTDNCWAPETIYDTAHGRYIITWSSDVAGRYPETRSADRKNNRTYYVVTTDFETFSEPAVYLDPGFDHIDTTVVERDGKFVVVFKEGDMQAKGRAGALWLATGDGALGPFTVDATPITTERAEGPTLVTVGGKTLLYIDFYADRHYGVYETTDWKTWTDVTASASVVPGQRHGTIFAVPGTLAQRLLPPAPEEMARIPPPILDGFTADPAIRVFGDTYYVYPTSDRPNWLTTDFSVWSSKNLVEWQNEGIILDVAHDLAWGKLRAWAPDCIERDGTYYFYFCAEHKIGVATARSPLGPFEDALGRPLIEKGGAVTTNTIDPAAFIDDDGQAYLYFGNGSFAQVYRLRPDMVSFDGDPVTLPLRDFREAVWVFKRRGKYYFMWSVDDARSPEYRVAYGISDSPLGPVTGPADDIVLRRHGFAVGTAHHSVVNVPGTDRWYVAYHRHAIPGGSGYKRQTCLVRMEFDDDGSIRPMDPLTAPFGPGDEGEPLTDGRGRP